MKKFFLALCCFLFLYAPVNINSAFDHTSPVEYATALSFSSSDGQIIIGNEGFPSMTDPESPAELIKKPLDKYKSIATIVTAFLTVTAFLSLIFCITKLSTAGDNEMLRRKAIMGILTSGIGIALLGSVTVFIAFFWNLFD